MTDEHISAAGLVQESSISALPTLKRPPSDSNVMLFEDIGDEGENEEEDDEDDDNQNSFDTDNDG